MSEPLNNELLPENTCFGCGLHNPRGLRIEVRPDPEGRSILRARFTPTATWPDFRR